MSQRVETQTVREGLFRFGQWFSAQNRKFVFYRDPVANFICKGVVDDAMSKTFDVVAPGTEDILDWNNDMHKVMPDHYAEFLQAMYFQRRDGKALQSFMEKDGNLVNFAGAMGQYRLYRNAMGQPTKGWFTPQIQDFPGVKVQRLDMAENDNFCELIVARREKIGEGMSAIEPLWDVLFAIYMLVSHSAYFIARAGSGLKKAKVPENVIVDAGSSDVLNTLATAMTEFGCASDTIIVPAELGGIPIEFDIVTVDSPLDFMRFLDMYLAIISIQTGIPASTLKGLIPGQLAGAIVNEESYFDFQRDLQAQYLKYCIWFVRQLNKHYKFMTASKEKEEDSDDNDDPEKDSSIISSDINTDDLVEFNPDDLEFDILFRTRKVMSEMDEINLLEKKLDLAGKWKKIGLTTIKALQKSKIEGIEKGDLREGIDEPIDFTKEGSKVPAIIDEDAESDGDKDDSKE